MMMPKPVYYSHKVSEMYATLYARESYNTHSLQRDFAFKHIKERSKHCNMQIDKQKFNPLPFPLARSMKKTLTGTLCLETSRLQLGST